EEFAVEEIDPLQLQLGADKSDHQIKDDQEESGAFDHAFAAGAAEEAHDGIDEQANDQQLDADLPPAVDADGLPEIDQVEEVVIHQLRSEERRVGKECRSRWWRNPKK